MNVSSKRTLLRMFSQSVHRKHSPNILIRFGREPAIQNRQAACQTLGRIVQEFYGNDRFVLYAVSDDDLKCDSRTWSAAGIVSFSSASPNPTLDIPTIELEPEMLDSPSELRKKLSTFFNDNVEPLSSGHSTSGFFNPEMRRKPTTLYTFGDSLQSNVESNVSNLFRYEDYLSELQTKNHFGTVVHFQEIATSTMDMIKNVLNINGSLAVCNYQLSGIGRNENQWLSPEGCAMWTINLFFRADDPLFTRISLLQHVTSLAILRSIPDHSELELAIKWPNDILYRATQSKLCGVITKCVFNQTVNVQIGIGLNLDNRFPSICLNELIHFHNDQKLKRKMAPITRETLLARFMNNLENLLTDIVSDDGLKQFKQDYTNNWIHRDCIVDIHDGRSGSVIVRKAAICSIDDFGFLLVRDLQTGHLLSLQPEGNRFDLMNSLVVLNK